jgi:hypothetical protein
VGGDVTKAFASVSGVLGLAGTAFGIAAAAGLAYKTGEALIDSKYEDEEGQLKRVERASSAAAPRNAKERDAQVAELEASIAGSKDVGKGFVNSFLGGGARMMSGLKGEGFSPPELDTAGIAERRREEARKRIEQLGGMRFGTTTIDAPAAAAAAGGAARAPMIDAAGSHMIGVATATAIGGKVLDVRVRNLGELGLGRATAGPGGGRGPLVVKPAAPGGGY